MHRNIVVFYLILISIVASKTAHLSILEVNN